MEGIHLSILQSAQAGILACDTKGSVLFLNDRAHEVLGLDSGVTSRNAAESFLDAFNIREDIRTAHGRFRIVILPHGGGKLIASSSLLRKKGKATGVVYLFFPVEGIAEAALGRIDTRERSTFDLEAIIENTYDGLYITDGNADTLMVNKAYERITGIKRSEVLGKNMRQLVASGVINRSVSLEVIEKKAPVTILQELRSGKTMLVTGNPVFAKGTKDIVLVVTNARDITELIHLRDQLHERTLEVNRYLAELDKIKTLQQQSQFVAKSKKMCRVLETAVKAAQFDSTVLITGESGVGKGLMAKLMHETSDRKNYPFVVINCAGIPEDLFESELFGYEPGAFSGASAKGKKGLLEVADKGTIFLDEIGDMSLRLQSKLLRVIEEKEMVRLGSTKTIRLDVRITAATNQDIASLIEAKRFRQDLFFRLNCIPIMIPPLRERMEDVIPLIQYFTEKLNQRYRMKKSLTPRAVQVLMTCRYPGNVRELANIVEQSFLIGSKEVIDVEDLPLQITSLAEPQAYSIETGDRSFNDIIDLMEYRILKSAIDKYGSTHKAARNLKISQSTIVRKMKKLNKKNLDR